jgi:hypothetical protein
MGETSGMETLAEHFVTAWNTRDLERFTTLGRERLALSSGSKPRSGSRPSILGGKTIDQLEDLVRSDRVNCGGVRRIASCGNTWPRTYFA